MARIYRGTRPIKRENARNYTNKQAQARLDETVKPFNKQTTNALFVNAVEVDFYQAVGTIGKPCTCEKVEIQQGHIESVSTSNDDTDFVAPIIPTPDDDNAGVSIRLKESDLFGDGPAEKLYGSVYSVSITGNDAFDDIPKALQDDINKLEANSNYEETSMFGATMNCGICYKTGVQPGYRAYGKQRVLLTTWDVQDMQGFMIRTSDTPNTFVRQGNPKTAFVEFAVNVPTYFVGCMVSIRNNMKVLTNKPFMGDYELSLAIMKGFAGREMHLRVNVHEFTHMVLEFDLGVDKLRANIGAEMETLDYTRLEAIENFPVILPPKIHAVNSGDVLIIPKRGLALKVTDTERKITADKRRLEWSVQTRLIQKLEPLRLINKGIKLI